MYYLTPSPPPPSTSSPPADLWGFDLWPLAVYQCGVCGPAAGPHPHLRQPGGGPEPPRHPRHLQSQPAGEGGLTGGNVEHHPAATRGETHMRWRRRLCSHARNTPRASLQAKAPSCWSDLISKTGTVSLSWPISALARDYLSLASYLAKMDA